MVGRHRNGAVPSCSRMRSAAPICSHLEQFGLPLFANRRRASWAVIHLPTLAIGSWQGPCSVPRSSREVGASQTSL